MRPEAGDDGWNYLPEGAAGAFEQRPYDDTAPHATTELSGTGLPPEQLTQKLEYAEGGAHFAAAPPGDSGRASSFRRSMPARVMGLGAAVTVTATAALIGFNVGTDGQADSVLTIGDGTVPPTEMTRPSAGDGDGTTTTAEASTTTGETTSTTGSSTTVAPTTTVAPEPEQPDPTPTTTSPGDGDRPPVVPSSTTTEPDNSVTVPDLDHMTWDEARYALWDVGLQADPTWDEPRNYHYRGRVQDQDPGAGSQVESGSTVQLSIGWGGH